MKVAGDSTRCVVRISNTLQRFRQNVRQLKTVGHDGFAVQPDATFEFEDFAHLIRQLGIRVQCIARSREASKACPLHSHQHSQSILVEKRVMRVELLHRVKSGGQQNSSGLSRHFLEHGTGNIFESEAGFPKSELSSQTTVVPSTEGQIRFSLELPRNQPVAIAVFQDLDGNGTLSKNQIGIPTEPYGFSNNARGLLGPPSFRQAVFTISDGRDRAEAMEIKVR